MENYIMLTLLKEDLTIKLRFETHPNKQGHYFVYTVDIKNGEKQQEVYEGEKQLLPNEIRKKIELYQYISKKTYPLLQSGNMHIREKAYEEKRTIGLLPNWRYTKEKQVDYRTICEVTFQEVLTGENYLFHIDPKDELYRILLNVNQQYVDVTSVLTKEIKEKMYTYFMHYSTYRLKILYLTNRYQ